jgi:hypothetical protein
MTWRRLPSLVLLLSMSGCSASVRRGTGIAFAATGGTGTVAGVVALSTECLRMKRCEPPGTSIAGALIGGGLALAGLGGLLLLSSSRRRAAPPVNDPSRRGSDHLAGAHEDPAPPAASAPPPRPCSVVQLPSALQERGYSLRNPTYCYEHAPPAAPAPSSTSGLTTPRFGRKTSPP